MPDNEGGRQVKCDGLSNDPEARREFDEWFERNKDALDEYTLQGRALCGFRAGWEAGRATLLDEHPLP